LSDYLLRDACCLGSLVRNRGLLLRSRSTLQLRSDPQLIPEEAAGDFLRKCLKDSCKFFFRIDEEDCIDHVLEFIVQPSRATATE
jgi:hypothetical protein